MAKKALVNKANRKPKFAVRGYTRCQRCGRPHAVFRKFGLCRICLREMAHAGRAARRQQVQLVDPLPRRPALRSRAAIPSLRRAGPAPSLRDPAHEEPRRERHDLHDDDRPDRGHAHAVCGTPTRPTTTRLPCRTSKLKTHIAEILQQEGYIAGWSVDEVEQDGAPARSWWSTSSTARTASGSIAGVRRVSKPGLRVYAKSTALPKVLGGLGVAIISTSTGLLTDKQATKKGVGGEVLAYVW